MNTDTIILTRKIQLVIDSRDSAFIRETYKRLYQWQYACFRAANYIYTHHFLKEQIKELIYLTEETKVKLADITKDADGILTTSKLNTTYQILAKHFKGDIPMHILGSLNMTLTTHFKNEKLYYLRGEKSLHNYKKNIPIPIKGIDIRQLQLTSNRKNFQFNLFKIPFRTYLGKDFYDKRILLERALQGSVKIVTSALRLNKGKIFMLASFQIDKEKKKLDSAIIAEASLSMEYPITVKIGKNRYTIGSKEEFLHRRLAIQSARQRMQKAATYNRSGHGRGRKLKTLDRFHHKENSYINYKLHVYSRRLIDLCLKHKAATLLLVNQQEKEAEAQADEFLFRNWSYGGLKEKIAYKADKVGITLIVE
jgi:hypothetical protein